MERWSLHGGIPKTVGHTGRMGSVWTAISGGYEMVCIGAQIIWGQVLARRRVGTGNGPTSTRQHGGATNRDGSRNRERAESNGGNRSGGVWPMG